MLRFNPNIPHQYCVRERRPAVPEDDVVRMWLQRAQPDVEFISRDGITVRVIDPGARNRHDGPDFIGAAITVDGVLRRGAIEVHTFPEDWHRHGHAGDVRYKDVVLHVCLYDGVAAVHCPTIVLSSQLGQPFRQAWGKARTARHPLPCQRAGTLTPSSARSIHVSRQLPVADLISAMTVCTAARRFDRKLRRMAVRFDVLRREQDPAPAFRQLVYETFARAAGYGGNERQFESLARTVPLHELSALSPRIRAAHLAASAGLLHNKAVLLHNPFGQGVDSPARSSVRWNSSAVMPHNRIGRRLAWFSAWASLLDTPAWWRRLFTLLHNGASDATAFAPLFLAADERENPGPERIAEFMINVLAPALRLYGLQRGDRLLARAALKLYVTSVPAPQNRHTRLLTRAFEIPCDTGAQQQGMIELSTEFCEKERCAQCLLSQL